MAESALPSIDQIRKWLADSDEVGFVRDRIYEIVASFRATRHRSDSLEQTVRIEVLDAGPTVDKEHRFKLHVHADTHPADDVRVTGVVPTRSRRRSGASGGSSSTPTPCRATGAEGERSTDVEAAGAAAASARPDTGR